jgi:hypothetical protein
MVRQLKQTLHSGPSVTAQGELSFSNTLPFRTRKFKLPLPALHLVVIL